MAETEPLQVKQADLGDSATLYLDLLERLILRLGLGEQDFRQIQPASPRRRRFVRALNGQLRHFQLALTRTTSSTSALRTQGRDWPADAESMIGLARMRNIRECATDVIRSDIAGDFVEAGIWRGGAAIYMRAILAATGDRERQVWGFDSFEGLPRPSGRYDYASDASDDLWKIDQLGASVAEVTANFEKYGLFDSRVQLVKGWFKDTMSSASIEAIALLRLDGDLYESITDTLSGLYHKVSVGGYIIVDDYYHIPQCRQAVEDFRAANSIEEPLHKVDWNACFWKKSSPRD